MSKKMIGVKDAAKRAGISVRRFQQLLASKRIPGAQIISGVWVVPEEFTVTPVDPDRRRPGKIAYGQK